MKLSYKIASGVSTAALMAALTVPAAFASTTVIAGNGAWSHNSTSTVVLSSSSVHQTNNTHVSNGIFVDSNTGGNTAHGNTGGNTGISTGGVTNGVTTLVGGSTNTSSAKMTPCGCTGTNDVLIAGNGKGSMNGVSSFTYSTTSMSQHNTTNVTNFIDLDSNTGQNTASGNTGGSTGVGTGSVMNTVTTAVSGSSNSM